MTTQVLIRHTMGDNNTSSLQSNDDVSSPSLVGIRGGVTPAQNTNSSPNRDLETTLLLAGTIASPSQRKKQEATEAVSKATASDTMISSKLFATGAATSSPSLTGRRVDTGIVSHLRNLSLSSYGSAHRQDFESTLRAKNMNNNSLDNGFQGLGSARASSSVAAGCVSLGGQGLAMLLNNGGSASASSTSIGNQYASLLLQSQLCTEAALSQLAMNSNSITMTMLSQSQQTIPSTFLTSRLGIGNFANLVGFNNIFKNNTSSSADSKSPASLDPRLLGTGPGLVAAAAAAAQGAAAKRKRGPIVLYMECDIDSLSEYQCLIRQQIELFGADKLEAASSVQGRNKQIVEGQVGIRCRHCAKVPPSNRQKGSMYFPTKLDRIYQAAQNLSAFHLCGNCKHVPEDVRKKIVFLRERKSPAGGGKRYWGEGVRCLGVVEDPIGLRFR